MGVRPPAQLPLALQFVDVGLTDYRWLYSRMRSRAHAIQDRVTLISTRLQIVRKHLSDSQSSRDKGAIAKC